MKKQFILIIAFSLASFASLQLLSNPTITLPNVEAVPGTVIIPVTIDFSANGPFCSADFSIHFDTNVLQYVGVNNLNPAAGGVVAPAPPHAEPPVVIAWVDLDDIGTSMSGVLFELEFDYLGGDSDIIFFNPNTNGSTAIFSCDDDTTPANAIFNNGSVVAPLPPPVPISNLAVLFGLGFMTLFIAIRIFKG